MNAVGKSVTGLRRKNNEDSIFLSNQSEGSGLFPPLYIVADGMGGHNGGEIASSVSIAAFCEYIKYHSFAEPEELLDHMVGAVQYANSVLFQKANENADLLGMGTTFDAATIAGDKLYIVHVGDSRLYLVRNGELQQITQDHSWVMEMVRQGKLTQEEALVHPQKNIITRALGTEEAVEADTVIEPLSENDSILLCTDGLTNMLTDDKIQSILVSQDTLEHRAERLIAEANAGGGLDNISIIIIE